MSGVVQRLWVLLAFLLACGSPVRARDLTLPGRVVDENDAPVAGARVVVRPGDIEAQSGPTGTFSLTLPAPGDYVIHVDREGYYELKNQPVRVTASQQITLVLNTVREVFQTVNVREQPSPVDLARTQKEERLTGTEINNIPYPSSHSLPNALKLMPGVVQDPTGALHFNGSSEDQVGYTLNGFDIADPISGGFETRLGMEGVRSLNYWSGLCSPETGKGTAGALAIGTASGTDQWRYTATNFIPSLNSKQGLRLGSWYPRFGVSGPIVRGRAWFADNFDAEYSQAVVSDLPRGENTRSGWAGGNLLHTQVNITPSNIVFTDFLVNTDSEGRYGLGPLDPASTTIDLRVRQYFTSVKDQIYLGHGTLMEFGYAHDYISNHQTPQGPGLYILSPSGRSGNNFTNFYQTASRDQGLVNVYLPAFRAAGTHLLKAGLDADRLSYSGTFDRSGYEIIGLTGQLLSRTLFQGLASFHLSDTEVSSYLLDAWRPRERLQIDLGVRQDWDRQIGSVAFSPRIAFSWAPFASGRTRVSGGYTITHDAVNFSLLGRPLDQTASTVHYNPDSTPAGPPSITRFTREPGELKLPRASNWSIGVDHQLAERIFASANYLRRRGTDGFVFVNTLAPDTPPFESPLPDVVSGGIYQLTNLRRDDYDQLQFTFRQSFTGQYEWMASYTYSRARSNAVLDLHTSQPVQVMQDLAPVPWDTPHRFLTWAYLPLPWKDWAIAFLADARSGFPFSARDETGRIVGGVHSHRFPFNFDLNIHAERMITFRGYRFALRGGCNNLTNQANPTAVNNTIGAPEFLKFYGDEGRHFVVRIRFFGHAKQN
jgi:hypothetical protein